MVRLNARRDLLRDLLRALAAALAAAVGMPAARAQAAPTAAETRIKAAFLFKFLAFVEWPGHAFAQTDTPLVIGVIGADALAAELADVVAGRQVNGRRIEVQRLRPDDPVGELHVLFLGRRTGSRAAALVGSARARALLTVSESDDLFALGSTINFVVVDDKVRFDVALPPAEQSGLKISARLLAVARRVLASPS